MKIGVISDTHDNLHSIATAVELLNEEGVEVVLHAGDIISPFTAKEFSKLKCPFIAVFGNNDGEKQHLLSMYKSLGMDIRGKFAEETLAGKKIALLHGEIQQYVRALAASGMYNAVFFGHTHQVYCENIDGVLVLNPGEACGYLTGKKTFAVVDLERLDAEIKTF
ncbi:MAG: metallophosphoesterase [Candidatus Odinarchaeia archaeon]